MSNLKYSFLGTSRPQRVISCIAGILLGIALMRGEILSGMGGLLGFAVLLGSSATLVNEFKKQDSQ